MVWSYVITNGIGLLVRVIGKVNGYAYVETLFDTIGLLELDVLLTREKNVFPILCPLNKHCSLFFRFSACFLSKAATF